MTTKPLIVWLRQDLRVADNPALEAAAATGRPIVPLYIYEDHALWRPGTASRWWLHGSLENLAAHLRTLGLTLIFRRGNAARQLNKVITETDAHGVYWNRCYDPEAVRHDHSIETELKRRGLAAETFNSSLLFEPWEIKNRSGGPYRVFTPFWKAASQFKPRPASTSKLKASPCRKQIESDDLASWNLRPKAPTHLSGLRETWEPGESAARTAWETFLDDVSDSYHAKRDYPGIPATSRLSAHLHFGEISPHQIWTACERAEPTRGLAAFQRQLMWREFSHHLLYHFPRMATDPLREEFAAFPWHVDRKTLKIWQQGQTGYPIVDAGMRELLQTGSMHNRVRMIVASFLVKHLLQPWQAGAAWFWDTLVDADLANNAASWQWVAGCGTDASPFNRVFNPTLQGQKFDGDGAYVRRWVPELAALPDKYIHIPWEAPRADLHFAKVRLGRNYPIRIIEHATGRRQALAALKRLKKGEK
jgi:deoxyribodipyrimidine photo-lyase